MDEEYYGWVMSASDRLRYYPEKTYDSFPYTRSISITGNKNSSIYLFDNTIGDNKKVMPLASLFKEIPTETELTLFELEFGFKFPLVEYNEAAKKYKESSNEF